MSTATAPVAAPKATNLTLDDLIASLQDQLNKCVEVKAMLGGNGAVLVPQNTGTTAPPRPTAPAPAAAPRPKHAAPAATAAVAPTVAPATATAPAAVVGTPTEGTATSKKVAPTERNYSNDKSLKTVVFEVLDRPENGSGLKIVDIIKIIETEGIWKSSSDDISNMVSGAVYKLKEAGKLVRGEGKKYYVPEGATLTGSESAD